MIITFGVECNSLKNNLKAIAVWKEVEIDQFPDLNVIL